MWDPIDSTNTVWEPPPVLNVGSHFAELHLVWKTDLFRRPTMSLLQQKNPAHSCDADSKKRSDTPILRASSEPPQCNGHSLLQGHTSAEIGVLPLQNWTQLVGQEAKRFFRHPGVLHPLLVCEAGNNHIHIPRIGCAPRPTVCGGNVVTRVASETHTHRHRLHILVLVEMACNH